MDIGILILFFSPWILAFFKAGEMNKAGSLIFFMLLFFIASATAFLMITGVLEYFHFTWRMRAIIGIFLLHWGFGFWVWFYYRKAVLKHKQETRTLAEETILDDF